MTKKYEITRRGNRTLSNFRVMNTPSEMQGKDYYQVVEVVYDEKLNPVDFTLPCLSALTYKDLLLVLDELILAFDRTVLHEKDIRNKEQQ